MSGLLGSLVLSAAADAATDVHDIPRLDGVIVDGRFDDWNNGGFHVAVLHDEKPGRKACADFDVEARLAWDARGLLGWVNVTDNVILEAEKDADLWQCDGVEVFVAPGVGELDLVQAVFAPGLSPAHDAARMSLGDFRVTPGLKAVPLTAQVERAKATQGYALEFLIPWTNLGVNPEPGRVVAVQLHVNDIDRIEDAWWGRRTLFLNAGGGGCQWDRGKMTALRLAERAGVPVTAAARVTHEDFRRIAVEFATATEAPNSTLTVVADGRPQGSAILEANGRLSVADLELPMPPPGSTYTQLELRVADRTLVRTGLPGLLAERANAFEKEALLFRPFVFEGVRFPKPEFAQPAAVEDLIGRYILRTTYYDAAYNAVTEAARPGRYGAVVEVQSANGPVTRRFVTLFRQKDKVPWKTLEWPGALPPGMGIEAVVASEHADLVGVFAKAQFQEGLRRDPASAVLLAGLSVTVPGTQFVKRTNVEAMDKAWWYGLKSKLGLLTPLRYHLYVPEAAAREPQRRWPTFLWLHGSSTPWEKAAKTELIAHARGTQDFPYIVIAPNCPINERWDPLAIRDLLADLQTKVPIDPDRVFLSGTSMGGYGTWATATAFPELFAAAIPLCGGGDPEDVGRIKGLPIWVFHGTSDTVVPIARSEEMVAALRKVGGRVRFSTLDCGHDPGRLVFTDPALYEWLAGQVRGKPGHLPSDPPASTVAPP